VPSVEPRFPAAHGLSSFSGQNGASMTRARWSLEDAKNSFSAVVEAAVEDYERLRQGERANAPRFNDHLLSMPTGHTDEQSAAVKLRDVTF
jgi:antitoxin Phd